MRPSAPPICFGEQAQQQERMIDTLTERVRELERELSVVVAGHMLGTLTRDDCMAAIDLAQGTRRD